PRPPTMPFLDSIAALGFLAAHTRTMKLATGVLLLPQHNPLLLAKQLASVDVLSGGRLIVGIGVGGVEQEARAMGSPMRERGSRANDYQRTAALGDIEIRMECEFVERTLLHIVVQPPSAARPAGAHRIHRGRTERRKNRSPTSSWLKPQARS